MSKVELQELQPEMAAEVTALIAAAMNRDEGEWAEATIARHLDMRARGLSDGRRYFVLRVEGEVAGITGLHHYEWGPEENVWLGWFAVSPRFHGKGFGLLLMEETEKAALDLGYRKLFIETYDSPEFQRAISFYRKAGFSRVGGVADYLPDGSSMVVFFKKLG